MTWTFLISKIEPELLYLIEAFKVEGYWSLIHREASIQNKNMRLLNNIENILSKYKINFTKRLLIKIKPTNQNFSKEEILLLKNKKEIKFHIENSLFDKSRKIVFNLPFKLNQAVQFIFKNKQGIVNIKVCKDQINIKSKFPSFGYAEIRINNTDFIRFIDNYSGEKGSHTIRLDRFIFNKPLEFVFAAFSALIDCEGSIDYYGYMRRIRIRMCNLDYLKDWNKLLSKFKIHSNIVRDRHLWNLYINGWQNFDKLHNLGINLYHSKKREKLEKILNSYQKKQISQNTWKDFYISQLKSIGRPVSAVEFAKILGKSKRVVNHFLTKLDREGLIKVDKSAVKYIYSVR